MTRTDRGPILNKFGEERPIPVMTRLMHKQRVKIRKKARKGDRSGYVRRAVDAYEGD